MQTQKDITINDGQAVISFNFQNQHISATLENGEPFFAAKEICEVLGYENPSKTINDHCKPKGITFRYTLTSGGKQKAIFINEPNLYRLIIKSRKPEAEKFEEWVMSEVLPQIRKTGAYTPTLSAAQRGELFTLLSEKVEGKDRPAAWGRFNNHFKIASYKDLPPSRFEEAKEYIQKTDFIKKRRSNVVTTRPMKYAIAKQMAQFRRFNYEEAFDALNVLANRAKGRDKELILEKLQLIRACLDRCATEADEVAVLLATATARFNRWTGTGIF